VRGLDYYTRTTFEFTHGGLGAQNALLGGGRYDGLSEAIGGPKAPGIGFAMGEDRLVLTLQALETSASPQLVDAYIAPLGDAKDEAALSRMNAAGLALAASCVAAASASNWATAVSVSRSPSKPPTRLPGAS